MLSQLVPFVQNILDNASCPGIISVKLSYRPVGHRTASTLQVKSMDTPDFSDNRVKFRAIKI